MNNTIQNRCAIVFAVVVCALLTCAAASAGTVTVTTPNGGQAWNVGDTATIMWTYSGVSGNVNVWLYNNWTKVRILATQNVTNNTYYWPIPTNEPANNMYRIRVQSANDAAATDYGDGTFTINAPITIAVSAPNGGETWDAGTAEHITWTSTGLWGNANIYLYNNWTKIRKLATVPMQQGTYYWGIPSNELPNNAYRIRIQSALDTSKNDYSNATFTILNGTPSIHVATPNGGESWPRGAARQISWTSTGLWGNVKIWIYDNWTKIGALGTAPVQAGSWTWYIPSGWEINSTYRIRVQSLANTAINDYGDGLFSIRDVVPGDSETVMLPGSVPLVLQWIPDGTYLMGAYPAEAGSDASERPQHSVTLNGFWMGKYELTKAQWEAVMGTTPWSGLANISTDPNSPAVYVTWDDTQAFTTALNTYTGRTFRLPSESEWEYACRAGHGTRYYWGDDLDYTAIDAYAWHGGNCATEQYGHVVGTKTGNDWGLRDMSGNVFEWCHDWYHSDYTGAPTDGSAWLLPAGTNRPVRGGDFANFGVHSRSARRFQCLPDMSGSNIGFRVVR